MGSQKMPSGRRYGQLFTEISDEEIRSDDHRTIPPLVCDVLDPIDSLSRHRQTDRQKVLLQYSRPKCQFSNPAPLLRPDRELLISKSLASACPLGDRRPLCYDRRGQPQSLFFSERAGCRKGPDTGISSRGHRVQVSSVQRCTFQQGRNCFTWWRGPRI